MSIAAVFLDFDGTLVESLDVKIKAFRDLYSPFGDEIANKAAQHYRAHTGIPRGERIRYCHQHLLGRTPTDREVKQLSDQFGAMVEDQVIASPWVAGAEALFAACGDRIPLFIVSATPQEELERIVEARGATEHFANILGSPPDKIPLLHDLLSTHWLDRADVVMVGDGRADFDAATANGIPFIARQAPDQEAPFPAGTTVLSDLTDLPRLLGL